MTAPTIHLSSTVELSRVETLCLLRHLRARRDAMATDLKNLQERAAAMDADMLTQSAILALSNDLVILEAVIQHIWLPIAGSLLDETRGLPGKALNPEYEEERPDKKKE